MAILPAAALARDPPRRTIVVDVVDDSAEFDAEAARADIARELAADVVKPRDRRAADATEKIRIVVSDAEHMLRVAYEGDSGSNERTIDLPPDRVLAERAAVILASNLARDEASQLAADLKREKPAPPTTDPSPTKEDVDPDDEEAARLGKALAVEAQRARGWNSAADWVLGAGFGAGAAGAAMTFLGLTGQTTSADLVWVLYGTSVAFLPLSGLLRQGDFDELSVRFATERANGSSSGAIVEDVERIWQWRARNERNRRKVAGWLGVIAGGGLVVAGSWFYFQSTQTPETSFFSPAFIAFGAAGLLDLAAGIAFVALPSPMESAWRSYKGPASSVGAPGSATLTPFLGPVATGGAVVGMSGQF
jgi:hypothetical protein